MTVNTLEIKWKARSLSLGVDLDGAVQEYIQSLRMARGVVNTLVVIAASEPYRQMKITSISILKLSPNIRRANYSVHTVFPCHFKS